MDGGVDVNKREESYYITFFAGGPGKISISPLRPPCTPRNPIETIAPRRGTALYAVLALHPKAPPLAGELLSVSEAEGGTVKQLGSFEPFPFRHGLRRNTFPACGDSFG